MFILRPDFTDLQRSDLHGMFHFASRQLLFDMPIPGYQYMCSVESNNAIMDCYQGSVEIQPENGSCSRTTAVKVSSEELIIILNANKKQNSAVFA